MAIFQTLGCRLSSGLSAPKLLLHFLVMLQFCLSKAVSGLIAVFLIGLLPYGVNGQSFIRDECIDKLLNLRVPIVLEVSNMQVTAILDLPLNGPLEMTITSPGVGEASAVSIVETPSDLAEASAVLGFKMARSLSAVKASFGVPEVEPLWINYSGFFHAIAEKRPSQHLWTLGSLPSINRSNLKTRRDRLCFGIRFLEQLGNDLETNDRSQYRRDYVHYDFYLTSHNELVTMRRLRSAGSESVMIEVIVSTIFGSDTLAPVTIQNLSRALKSVPSVRFFYQGSMCDQMNRFLLQFGPGEHRDKIFRVGTAVRDIY